MTDQRIEPARILAACSRPMHTVDLAKALGIPPEHKATYQALRETLALMVLGSWLVEQDGAYLACHFAQVILPPRLVALIELLLDRLVPKHTF